jgi:hypothetical protein
LPCEAQLLQIKILLRKLNSFETVEVSFIIANIPKESGKLYNTCLKLFSLAHSVEGNKAVERIIKKMWVYLGLQSQILGFALTFPRSCLGFYQFAESLPGLVERIGYHRITVLIRHSTNKLKLPCRS